MTDRRGPRAPQRLAALTAVLAAFLLCPNLAHAAKWKDPTDTEKKMVEDPEKGLVGAVYLEKNLLSADNIWRVYVRAKILSKAGFDIGTVEDLGPDAYVIAGRTVSPAGVVTELSKKDIRTMTTVKAAGVSLERKGFTLPALEPGCFIEYTYKEPGALGSGESYQTELLLQDKYPILRQELRTPNPFNFSSTFRKQNGVQLQFHEEPSQFVYEVSNAPPLYKEPWGRPKSERSALLTFAYVFEGISGENVDNFWRDATKRVLVPAVKKMMVRPGSLTNRLKTIEGSREGDAAGRLQAIYDYVVKNVKSRSALRAGEVVPKGGWKSNDDAGDALSHGEGTSEELAMVFASLIRADGWKFRIVFAPDGDKSYFRRDLLSIFQFDTWLVAASDPKNPSRVIYLSFEHPLLPFGVVPWNHLAVDCYALSLDDETAVVTQIPQAPPEQNARRRAWKIGVTEEGAIRAERESRWEGLQAFEIRSELYREGKEAWEKEIRDEYQKLDPPAQLNSISLEAAEDPAKVLVGRVQFERNGMASPLPGGRIEFAPLSLINETNPFTQEKRNDPIIFDFPYLDEDTLTIAVPDGYAVDALPARMERRNNVGRYAVSAERGTGDSVVVSRRFELTRFTGGPQFYPEYRSLFEAMVQGDTGFSIVFKKTTTGKKGN
jgi:hypothetical protein